MDTHGSAPYHYLICQLNNGIGEIILNRIELNNAFNELMITELIHAIDFFNHHDLCHILLLKANGKHFCAGADLNWMAKQIHMSEKENITDAAQLATLMQKLDTFSKPTLALINGSTYGGALGLICACDIAIASPDSTFCLSEVTLGLVPAVISPYVLRSMGQRMARRYILTAEIISASKAVELNLIHEISTDFTATLHSIIASIQKNSPQAILSAKKLIKNQENGEITNKTIQQTIENIAKIRVSKEGQEGISAFLEKRPPFWAKRFSANGEQ